MKNGCRARLIAWAWIIGSVSALLGGSTTQTMAGTLVGALEHGRARAEGLLRRQGILDPAPRVAHLSYVCTLRLTRAAMAVLDLREIVPGAVAPRGHNRILVLDGAGKVRSQIAYATERPLSYRGRRLLLQGSLAVDSLMPEGNVLSFGDTGRPGSVEQIDARDLRPSE
ncbi:MAG TPA: hypothetical protein VEZ16_08645 [Microvirga sp.]|nr:hypothetical protein [Microvirga sp.]